MKAGHITHVVSEAIAIAAKEAVMVMDGLGGAAIPRSSTCWRTAPKAAPSGARSQRDPAGDA